MTEESVSATRTIDAPPGAVFAVLADPGTHASIDGTGWVCESLEHEPLTAVGQIFWMAMYHPNHPDGGYRTANRLDVVDRPKAIGWATGYDPGNGILKFGGWTWRYDLRAAGPGRTDVTLTYDWSAATDEARGLIDFPPFPPDHLSNSLDHLAAITAAA